MARPVLSGMGRSRAITYTVQLVVSGKFHTPAEWRTRPRLNGVVPSHGKPTAENLTKYVSLHEESTRGDGCNKHLGEETVASAHIVHQPTGKVVASYVRAS